jgi:phage terminase large subunit-like protein
VFGLGNIYGWVEKLTGLRRFESAYFEVPKKSGKTFLAAGVGVKQGFYDGEPGAEVYSIATMRDQAKLVWDDAKEIIKNNIWLRAADKRAGRTGKGKIEILRGVQVLHDPVTASKFQPLGKDSNSADGKNPYCVIADELHRHKDEELLNVMAESMASRDDPLMLEITTAGIRSDTSVGWRHHQYATQILDGVQQNERRFCFIAGADEEDRDNWQDEKVWRKANPSWGVSVNPRQFKQSAVEAAGMPSKLNDFLRLRLNFWVDQHITWIPAKDWAACRARRPLAELAGELCYAGLDLGHSDDLAALVLIFQGHDEYGEFYDVFPYFWMPEPTYKKRLSDKSTFDYASAVRDGLIVTTPGRTTDQDFIKQKILDLRGEFNLAQVWYDQFMVKCLQYARTLHEPTKKVEELVAAKNLRHGENRALRWMNANVDIKTDSEGHIKIDKIKSAGKVDGMVAMVMALKGWIFHQSEPESAGFIYDNKEARPDGFLSI